MNRLQFSIGPVQAFVAQSRRTRDLWSSSFLLSHLAATAIEAVTKNSRSLVLPHASSLAEDARHDFGTIPNRFVADFADIHAGRQAAEAAHKAVADCWRDIASCIWERYVVSLKGLGCDTETIWNRQVYNFWEVSWVIGAPEESSALLAARKNWRTTPATVEPGDHCTMMGDRQELSGWVRSVSRDSREKQDAFWKTFRGLKEIGQLELAEDERLCAIALIKRLFPNVAEEVIGCKLNHKNWPSTAYVAAIPWLVAVAGCAKSKADAQAYAEIEVKSRAQNSLGERQSKIPKLVTLKDEGRTGDFLSLDGNFFQRSAIDNPKVTPLETLRDGESDDQARRTLKEQLAELSKTAGAKPSPFYALLLMDGDSMGTLLSHAREKNSAEGETDVSKALKYFAGQVPKIVGEHLGVTVYAGGDDVLAMVPLDGALKCAMQLSERYLTAFTDRLGNEIANQATLSGAIVYAHYHTPLRDVLKTAHHLLDDVAKEATGRDSLAIAVFKSSGITAQWAAPWGHIRDVGKNAKADNIIDALVCDLTRRDLTRRDHGDNSDATTDRSAEFSSGFLYNVRERFAALTDKALTKPGEFGRLSAELIEADTDGEDRLRTQAGQQSDNLLKSVLVADYLRGRQYQGSESEGGQKQSSAERHNERLSHARAAVDRLLKLSQRVTRQRVEGKKGDPPKFKIKPEPDTLGIDGSLIVRFLANDGKGDAE